MDASNYNIQVALQQMQDAAAGGVTKSFGFGLVMAFITTVFALTRQFSDAGRLNQATE
jgi:hypothetical protein